MNVSAQDLKRLTRFEVRSMTVDRSEREREKIQSFIGKESWKRKCLKTKGLRERHSRFRT